MVSPDVFVDGEALSEAIKRVAVDKFLRELREKLIYEGSKDMADVLSEYQKIVAGKNDKS